MKKNVDRPRSEGAVTTCNPFGGGSRKWKYGDHMGKQMNLDPLDIHPPHGAQLPRQFNELVEDMAANGWKGRPLLVIRCVSGKFQAWTGSHRIAAARKAGLQEVPCYVVMEKVLLRHDVDATWPVDDDERLKIIRNTKDQGAIDLMWRENRQ